MLVTNGQTSRRFTCPATYVNCADSPLILEDRWTTFSLQVICTAQRCWPECECFGYVRQREKGLEAVFSRAGLAHQHALLSPQAAQFASKANSVRTCLTTELRTSLLFLGHAPCVACATSTSTSVASPTRHQVPASREARNPLVLGVSFHVRSLPRERKTRSWVRPRDPSIPNLKRDCAAQATSLPAKAKPGHSGVRANSHTPRKLGQFFL